MSPVLLLFVGCGAEAPSLPDPDATIVEESLAATQPQALVELVERTGAYAALDLNCPMIVADEALDGSGIAESWVGGCATADGQSIEGTLRRFSGEEGAWIAAEDFVVRRDGDLELELRGSIELYEENDLLNIEVAGAVCGGPTWSCEDGPVTLDLAYSIYPASNFPHRYDATVSGVVATDGAAPISVEGVWSIDDEACATEPASGTISLRRSEHQALELDGQTACDGCADWLVHGVDVGPYCGLPR
jgi:hypothetical protein